MFNLILFIIFYNAFILSIGVFCVWIIINGVNSIYKGVKELKYQKKFNSIILNNYIPCGFFMFGIGCALISILLLFWMRVN